MTAGIADEAPDVLDRRGHDAYSLEDVETARTCWEQAFRSFDRSGDRKAQARIAISLGRLHFSSLGNEAAARGWLARAARLLEQVGPCVEQGHLELALLGCDVRDPAVLEQSARRALQLAIEFGDTGLQFRALAELGLALVSAGRTEDGFALLDEAMVPVISGELPAPGAIFCAALTACERTGELARLQEWLQLCQELVLDHLDGRFPVLQAHCRIAYGTVLCTVGRWPEAESELLHALGPEGTTLFARRVEATARLADLRILQGRLEEAAQLLNPLADRFEVGEALARLHLARAEPELAVPVLRRVLLQLGADRLRAVPVHALVVQAELARGDSDAAEVAVAALLTCAEGTDSALVQAEAALAQARVAAQRGDLPVACRRLDEAERCLAPSLRPVLAAQVRLARAELAVTTGDTATAVTEAGAALAAFERCGALREADRVRALLRRLGAPAPRPRDAGAGLTLLTAREREVLRQIAGGHTNAEIATRLFISAKTAEHHVSRILAKLGVRSRAEAAAYAIAHSART